MSRLASSAARLRSRWQLRGPAAGDKTQGRRKTLQPQRRRTANSGLDSKKGWPKA